jgi:hypothetical protein
MSRLLSLEGGYQSIHDALPVAALLFTFGGISQAFLMDH